MRSSLPRLVARPPIAPAADIVACVAIVGSTQMRNVGLVCEESHAVTILSLKNILTETLNLGRDQS